MSSFQWGKIAWYIQKALYKGREPESDGYYVFSRKELSDGAQISTGTFDKNKEELVSYFSSWCDLGKYGKYPEYAKEILYVDVKYEKGFFKFRRNPITLRPDLQHLWALPPLGSSFSYDSFDDKHRRRTNGQPIYDSFPWMWSEEEIQNELGRRKREGVEPPKNPAVEAEYEITQSKNDEEKRIEAIQRYGGRHLQNFKEENITYEMCMVAVKSDGSAIHFVPEKFKTREIYFAACKSHGDVFYCVPEEYVTKELCEVAVSSVGLVVERIPEEFKTRDMFLKAAMTNPLVMQIMPVEYLDVSFCVSVIQKFGTAAVKSLPKKFKNGKFYLSLVESVPDVLWEIPKSGRTLAVCKAAIKAMGYKATADAVRDNPELLSQLHTAMYDYETCLTFVKSDFFRNTVEHKEYGFNTNEDGIRGLLYMQERYYDQYSLKHMLRWYDVCEIVVCYLPFAIEYVQEDIITYDLCLSAIKGNGRLLNSIPTKFRTREICMIAFAHDAHNIEYFPEDLLSYDLFVQAVCRSGYILEQVPEKFMDRDLCMAAVAVDGRFIAYVPDNFLDEELCITAFQNLKEIGFALLKEIPESQRTYNVCLAAVCSKCGGNFDYVPEKHRTYELCLAAAENGCRVINVPEDFYTEELCCTMMRTSERWITYIPQHKLTAKICMTAVEHSGQFGSWVLRNIPQKFITQEMCNMSMNHPHDLSAIPEEFVTVEMLYFVAETAPGCLTSNFPERFRNSEFIHELIKKYPDAEHYVGRYLSA